MTPETERLYRAWRTAAERGYGSVRVDTPTRMNRIDANIRKLKARYEAALLADKATWSAAVLNAGPL